MFVICDIEANRLDNPDKIWCVVLREVDNPEKVHVFENVHEKPDRLRSFAKTISCWIGHNFLHFDLPCLADWGIQIYPNRVIDTLVVSRLINFKIDGGHSLEAWGKRLGEEKIGLDISDWSVYNNTILQRCIQDTLVNLKVYNYFKKYIYNKSFKNSLRTEHDITSICHQIKKDGFRFNVNEAKELYNEIEIRLKEIDNKLSLSFPPKRVLVTTIIPRFTKQGAIHAVDYRRLRAAGFSDDSIKEGQEHEIWEERPFEPGSLQQTIDRLWDAGWKPTEKTKGHAEHTSSRRSRSHRRFQTSVSGSDESRSERFARYGWKLSEENLRTLSNTAPEAATRLVERLLLASRLSDLTEWLNLAVEAPRRSGEHDDEYRIHGSFDGIGSWTHRLASNKPNMQNIPVAKHSDKETAIEVLANSINDRMRSLWIPSKGKRLLGVDADGIQMRIFAHYVNDKRLIDALVSGDKKSRTDIHSLHQQLLGSVCLSRDNAKTFIYAWLLGAGAAKVAEILGCNIRAAKEAIENFITGYPGLKELKQTRIPEDSSRGYFVGLDGRYVICPDEHRVLAGYLQNGEAVVMKRATIHWQKELKKERIPFKLVTWPHDEWQTEVDDDDDVAQHVIDIQVESIVRQGIELELNCPLAAQGKWGYSWKETH